VVAGRNAARRMTALMVSRNVTHRLHGCHRAVTFLAQTVPHSPHPVAPQTSTRVETPDAPQVGAPQFARLFNGAGQDNLNTNNLKDAAARKAQLNYSRFQYQDKTANNQVIAAAQLAY
jgi:hypothetical protein